jgi:hypothetical protein
MKTITLAGNAETITGCPALARLGIDKVEIAYGLAACKCPEFFGVGDGWVVMAAAEVKVNGVPWEHTVLADGVLTPPFKPTRIFTSSEEIPVGKMQEYSLHPKTRGYMRLSILGAAEDDYDRSVGNSVRERQPVGAGNRVWIG